MKPPVFLVLTSLTTNPVDNHYDDFSLKGSGAAPVIAKG
jgi:hypothetical protein